MLELKNPRIAVPLVLLAGIIWSFGPLVVRNLNDPQLIQWQYIFGRGLTIFILLNLYLYFEEGKSFYKNYFIPPLMRVIQRTACRVIFHLNRIKGGQLL